MKIKAGIIQFDIQPGKIDHNLAVAERLIRHGAEQGAGILCLPELFSTGYDFGFIRSECSENSCTQLRNWLGELTCSLRVYLVAGSIPEKIDDRFYNTSFFFNDQGAIIGQYRKINLFAPMGENSFFTPGQSGEVFDTPLGRIGIGICYDLRFPALFMGMASQRADLVFVPAQFPHPRLDHWRILLRARAIENYFFMAGCNRIGLSGQHLFCGHSCLISPWGETLAEAGEREGVLVASIDLDQVEETRGFFRG